jgi:beta-glucosidase
MGCGSSQSNQHARSSALNRNFEELLLPSSQPIRGNRISYMGCATSHFQSEPLLYDTNGNIRPPVTDWEFELQKNLRGEPSGIRVRQNKAALPRFSQVADRYINRSVEMGNNMFRISIDMGRLCPKENAFDETMMAEYVRQIALIKHSKQEPMVTLHHFTMPTFLVHVNKTGSIIDGAWEHPNVLNHVSFYVQSVVGFLANRDKMRTVLKGAGYTDEVQAEFLDEGLIRYFMSINEPLITSFNGYVTGIFPPYKRAHPTLCRAISDRLVSAHYIMRHAIQKLDTLLPHGKATQLGVGYNWQFYDGPFGHVVHKYFNELYTNAFERAAASSDFIGLHYYCRQTMPFYSVRWKGRVYSDMPGFGDIYPPGVYDLLHIMHRLFPEKPIFVSEIGFSDASDFRRPFWILETVRSILSAWRDGVPVLGVLLWTLVNNFEWNLGMTQKFGLFAESDLTTAPHTVANTMHSWEAWKCVVDAILQPSAEAISHLQAQYSKAKSQCEQCV